jgi:protein-arginine kinase activator protein McsA
MKLMMFDFGCSACGLVSEDLVDPSTRIINCPNCGKPASRMISPVRIDRSAIALTEGASPESIAHFDHVHRERRALEEKRFAEHGDYGSAAGAD